MEEIFSNNEQKENNWTFHYPIIKDKNGKLICTTFFTSAWAKDDVLALENISKKIETIREREPYFLCSKTLTMGSLFSEGNFLYLDTEHPQWEEAISILFKYVSKIKKETESTTVIFRDFEEDFVLNKVLENEGYAKVRMPNRNIVENPYWENEAALIKLISSKNKRDNIKRYVFRYQDKFEVTIKKNLTDFESKEYYKLFNNVKRINFAFNFFAFPEKIVSVLEKYDEWEFIDIKLKGTDILVACIWNYVGRNHYSPLIAGLNYEYLETHQLYKQVVFQAVKRGNELKKKFNYLGLSADFEKQKYLAKTYPTFAFMKVDDTYNLELVESFSNI
jgi:hypothetical protein